MLNMFFIQNSKFLNCPGDAATMYQLGFQYPAIKLNSNKKYSSTSITLFDFKNLLDNSLVEKTSLEYSTLLDLVAILEEIVKENPSEKEGAEKLFIKCLSTVKKSENPAYWAFVGFDMAKKIKEDIIKKKIKIQLYTL